MRYGIRLFRIYRYSSNLPCNPCSAALLHAPPPLLFHAQRGEGQKETQSGTKKQWLSNLEMIRFWSIRWATKSRYIVRCPITLLKIWSLLQLWNKSDSKSYWKLWSGDMSFPVATTLHEKHCHRCTLKSGRALLTSSLTWPFWPATWSSRTCETVRPLGRSSEYPRSYKALGCRRTRAITVQSAVRVKPTVLFHPKTWKDLQGKISLYGQKKCACCPIYLSNRTAVWLSLLSTRVVVSNTRIVKYATRCSPTEHKWTQIESRTLCEGGAPIYC